jgi:hypothetical protein
MTAIPLTEQLRCVRREIGFRERVYARRVSEGRMTKAQADHELACMRAVEETIAELAKGEELAL